MNRASRLSLLPLTAAALLLTACAPEGGSSSGSSSMTGEEVFMVNCSPCHGESGRGPALSSIQGLSPEARRQAIRNHPQAGQIPQRLPAAQLGELLEWFDNPPE